MRVLKYARAVQFSSRQSALNMINFTCNFGFKMARSHPICVSLVTVMFPLVTLMFPLLYWSRPILTSLHRIFYCLWLIHVNLLFNFPIYLKETDFDFDWFRRLSTRKGFWVFNPIVGLAQIWPFSCPTRYGAKLFDTRRFRPCSNCAASTRNSTTWSSRTPPTRATSKRRRKFSTR